MDIVAIALSVLATVISAIAIWKTSKIGATTATPVTTEPTNTMYASASIGCFIIAIILSGVSTGYISSALNSALSWDTIQSNVSGYAIIMTVGAALIAVGTICFMMEFNAHSHIILAIMAALAFGLSSTAFAVASVAIP